LSFVMKPRSSRFEAAAGPAGRHIDFVPETLSRMNRQAVRLRFQSMMCSGRIGLNALVRFQ
jgi:hypothetical protein